MKILAVTCYTGDEALCDMTEAMLIGLHRTAKNHELSVAVVGQGASRAMSSHLVAFQDSLPENVGFAYGMNRAIEIGVVQWKPDYVLCLNNDLMFPQSDWLGVLIRNARTDKVTSPVTDNTALHAQRGPNALSPLEVEELSAYCWLIPFSMCEALKKDHGFWLFSEDFAPAYGEDNWTAYLLRKQLGGNIFKLIRRSFVKHLRGRTAKIVPHDRAKTSKILADKFRGELKNPKLPKHLKAWATRYLKILKC